jgi:thiol-disulfide isomerase/thioredoxin
MKFEQVLNLALIAERSCRLVGHVTGHIVGRILVGEIAVIDGSSVAERRRKVLAGTGLTPWFRPGWLLVGALLATLSLVTVASADAWPPRTEAAAFGGRSETPAAGTGRATGNAADLPVVLLYFTQDQCPPCRQMQPMIEHLTARGFPLQKIDVAAHPDWTQQFQVQSTPTFVLLQNGRELKRHSGILTSYQINSLLIDAGYPTDQDVLSKPSTLSPIINFFDRLRPPARVAAREPSRESHQPVAQPTASIPPPALTSAERLALQATARIKVEYLDRGQRVTDFGTATVIHRHQQDILLLTCGHVFRDSQGRGSVTVELDFLEGQPKEVVPGQLLQYDAGAADVAILTARTRLPIQPMALAAADFQPQPQALTFSVGCDHGQPATVRRGNYLTTLRCGAVFQGGQTADEVMARKFGISGRPVVGRSGGGLFTADGRLIGVCNAAVVESDEGRYSAIDNVVDLLAANNLGGLFREDATTVATNQRTKFFPVVNPDRMAAVPEMDPRRHDPTRPPAGRPPQILGQSPR